MKNTSIVMVALCVVQSACLENPTPEHARVEIQGEPGKQVRLIISTQFLAVANELNQTRVEILEADTVTVTLPYSKVYSIEEDQRFFAETARLDNDLETFRMQVYLDDRIRFDEAGQLRTGQPYRFVYMFNQGVAREIVVI